MVFFKFLVYLFWTIIEKNEMVYQWIYTIYVVKFLSVAKDMYWVPVVANSFHKIAFNLCGNALWKFFSKCVICYKCVATNSLPQTTIHMHVGHIISRFILSQSIFSHRKTLSVRSLARLCVTTPLWIIQNELLTGTCQWAVT